MIGQMIKKTSFMLSIVAIVSFNATAFFSTNGFMPFGNGTGYTSTAPWSNNSNWNPMASGAQFSPANDARNMSRYSNRPSSLRNYRQNPAFQPNNAMMVMPNQMQPSNWLQETDFSKTLEQIKGSGSKTFFVNEMPVNFNEGYQNIQAQSQNIENAVKEQIKRARLTDDIYGKQGYGLSPAAASTLRVNAE